MSTNEDPYTNDRSFYEFALERPFEISKKIVTDLRRTADRVEGLISEAEKSGDSAKLAGDVLREINSQMTEVHEQQLVVVLTEVTRVLQWRLAETKDTEYVRG